MIFECLVIDNSTFYEDGTIRVRIKDNELNPLITMQDMSNNPDKSLGEYANASDIYGNTDTKAFLYTPYGGAYDFGLFALPQPNTRGLVAKLGNSFDADSDKAEYVYLGGLSKINLNTLDIDIPSDSISSSNGCNKGTVNLTDPGEAIVFKQKQAYISKDSSDNLTDTVVDESTNTLDWTKRPTQNMIVMDKNTFNIVHNMMDDDENITGQAQFKFSSEGISINYFNNDNNNESKINMTSDGSFEMSNTNSKSNITNSLSATTDSMNLYHNDKKCETSIYMGSDYNNKTTCNISVKSTSKPIPSEICISEEGIDITSNSNISINPGANGEVTLGNGQNGYVLTSLKAGAVEIGNVTLTAAKNIKA